METTISATKKTEAQTIPWQRVVAPYLNPNVWSSIWQIVNSMVPYFTFWVMMYYSLQISYWLTLLLSIPTAFFNVRIFIIMHDCGHGSFFKSQKVNNFLGIITGFLTLTPYYFWRHDHAIHHATACDLDRRGVGDVKTLTVDEYVRLSRRKRISYRIYRNPFILFGIIPLIKFVLVHRFPQFKADRRERRSILWTNVYLLGLLVLMSQTIGITAYALVQFPIFAIAASVAIWLFYVQHQFEDAQWEHHENWDYEEAALHGSSFYKLPGFLQWATGNIGFHHIHHLSPRIPNYKLEKCHNENAMFREVQPVTLLSSLKALRSRLWDREKNRFVGYKGLKPKIRQHASNQREYKN